MSMRGALPDSPPGSDSSLSDEFSKVALGSCTSPGWSDLPIDIILAILQRLELPQALAFASVCTTWRAAATAAGVPRCGPLILSWANHLKKTSFPQDECTALTCNWRHLLNVDKAYDVSFPHGCFVACCGASHGWLVLVNELSGLVLYNPFTTSMIPLPPVTDFSCVEAVYRSGGSSEHYLAAGITCHASSLGTWFYQKAVLSDSPSKGGDYTVMIIHCDSNWLSFVKAGQRKWQVASTIELSSRDRYADCTYHGGKFYTITVFGLVEKWDVDKLNGPTKEVVVAARHHLGPIFTRHLVPTPWGDLLGVSAILASGYSDGIRFQICKVDPNGCKKVSRKDLVDHALFLGLNHSSCLPIKNFPGLMDQCIYFCAPWMTQTCQYLNRLCCGWGGVRMYDLKRRKFGHALPFCCDSKGGINLHPTEVWITPNL